MQPASVSVNGRIVPAADLHLSVTDRGFQLGDGVFETLRAIGGVPIELAEHLERLRHSMAILEIPTTPDLERLVAIEIDRLLAAEGLHAAGSAAALRITVTRGAWVGRGLLAPAGLEPTVVLQVWPFEPPPLRFLDDGLAVVVATIRRDPEHPLATVKSTSRADSVLARLEAQRVGADDAVFLTNDGYLSEATSANIFVIQGGRLATPSGGCGILPGTTRAWLLAWASGAGLDGVENLLTTRDLAEADEAFLSSSVAGVVPVTRYEGRPIGTGRPGPWTLRARAGREACFGADGSASVR